jgi:hypothetical protein
MRLLLGALATLLLLPHGVVADEAVPVLGAVDSGGGVAWDRQQFPTLQNFQASTCYGHTCPAGLASIMDVNPCDCRQVDPTLSEGPGSKDVECCYLPCSAGATPCPDGSNHWRYPHETSDPNDACSYGTSTWGHGPCWDEAQSRCVDEDLSSPNEPVSCPSISAMRIDSWPCLDGVCSSHVCCAEGCTEK